MIRFSRSTLHIPGVLIRHQKRAFGWSDRLENFGKKQDQEENKWKEKYNYSDQKFQKVLNRFDSIRTSRRQRGQKAYQSFLAQYTSIASLKYWMMYSGLIGGVSLCSEMACPGVSLMVAPIFFFHAAFTFGTHMITTGRVPIRMGASKLDDDHEITKITKELVAQTNINPEHVGVYIINTSSPNAFASGFTNRSACVTVTQGLVDLLNKNELKAVLAHEVGHIVNGDMRLNLELVCIISSFYAMYRYSSRMNMYGPARRSSKKDNAAQAQLVIMCGSLVMLSIGKLLQLYISRDREYAADACGVALTGNLDLATALMKIDNYSRSDFRMKPSPLEKDGNGQLYGHMYLVPSASQAVSSAAGEPSLLQRLFSTHPPTKERIKAIQEDHQYLQSLTTKEREPTGYHKLGDTPESQFQSREI